MQRRLAVLLLFAIAACQRAETPDHAPAMQEALTSLRTAVAKFRDDNGRGPHALEELVPRYLDRVPADPITKLPTTWRLTTEESVQPSSDFSTSTTAPAKPQIVEVHSSAPGSDASGKRWSDY
ncbi:MAG TPA: hypothetical protein VEU30_09475 [Thermoanaerobaculia bacterium]|nr:hypothetical protein [Thermoanaerobaculia bacterium]